MLALRCKRYVINFRVMKFCMHEVPSFLKNSVVNFDYYLREKFPCESSFIFKGYIVISSLDDSCYDLLENNEKLVI